jgi:phosphatidylglycerophosphate synthase
MHKSKYYIINGITVYRMVAAFALVYFILIKRVDIFKWLLAFSFLTDAVDGYLARKYKVVSILGAKIDSIADDLTILAAIVGVLVLKPDFIRDQLPLIIVMLIVYLSQTIMAFVRYGRMSSFHTYLAKCAALSQGAFLILLFFLPQLPVWLFYVSAAFTILDLLEEIILVILLPKWQTDVKGLYWAKKKSVHKTRG